MSQQFTEELRQRRSYQRSAASEMREKCELRENSPLKPDPPILPHSALHGITGEIVSKHKDHTEASAAALLAQLLVGLGNLIGPNPFFKADGARHQVNLYTVICGRTAKARKGSSWARVKNILTELDDLWYSERVKTGVVSGEGVVQVFNDDPQERRLMLIEGEFGQVLQAMKRDGNTVSVLLRNAWDGGKLAVLRKSGKIEVDGAHISLIGHITLGELQRLLASVEISNGLANRILWVHSERAALLPEGDSAPELDTELSRLQRAVDSARGRGLVKRDSEARELWAEIYLELSQEPPGKLGELVSRSEAQVMRLALLYALLDEAPAIGTIHLQAALAFWRYSEASARFIFNEGILGKRASKIYSALKSKPLTMAEVHQLFHNHASKAEIESALAELDGLIEITATGVGGGRIIRRMA